MAENRGEFELNTCSSKTSNDLLQHGHEIRVDTQLNFIASIPVFTSSVTNFKGLGLHIGANCEA